MPLPPLAPLQQSGLAPPPPAAAPMPTGNPAPAPGLSAANLLAQEYDRLSGELPIARAKADTGLSEYMGSLRNYAPDPSEKWLAMAGALGKTTKFGTQGEAIENVSGALQPIVSKENALKNQYKQLAAQMGYEATEKRADELQSGKLSLLKDMTSLQSRQLGMSQRLFKLPDGTWAQRTMDGQVVPVAASQQALIHADYQKGLDMAIKVLDTKNPQDLEDYANQYVEKQAALRTANTTKIPGGELTTPPANIPGQPTPAVAAPPSASPTPPAGGGVAPASMGNFSEPEQVAQRTADQLAILEKEKQKYAAAGNFQAASQVQQQINQARAQMPTEAAPPNPAVQLKRKPEMEAEQKKLVGYQEHYGKMAETYSGASDIANKQLMAYQEMLNAMKLYKDSGGNQGTIAPYINRLQNLMQSAGVSLTPDELKQLIASQEIEKLNFELGGSAAKDINQSRATQLEVTLGMKNNPGIAMYEPAAQKMLGYLMAKANINRKQQDTFADWRDKFPTTDPSHFTSYWNLYHDYPEVEAKFSPEKIQALAKQSGASPIDIVKGIRQRMGAKK